MLKTLADSELLNHLELPLAHRFVLNNNLRLQPDDLPVIILTDNPGHPRAIAVCRGASMLCHAVSELDQRRFFEELLAGNIEPEVNWPAERVREEWQSYGHPYIFLNTTPLPAYHAAIAAGFIPTAGEDELHWAYPYHWSGKPKLSEAIAHSCRLGRELELWGQLRQGVGYDPEGEYVRILLKRNPSYVCEADGRPVSWSAIHLNGSMGMIFTPPEHRRQGYARSLAAFQIDHQLAQQQLAVCHVVSGNTASEKMLEALGGQKGDLPVVWRSITWPAGTSPW